MHYVYFLALSNNTIYNDGKVPATASFLPAKLKSYVAVETKEKAMALEKYFKTDSGKAVAMKPFL